MSAIGEHLAFARHAAELRAQAAGVKGTARERLLDRADEYERAAIEAWDDARAECRREEYESRCDEEEEEE